MLNIIIFLIGILGVALVSYGAWLILPACGFITAGCILILWSYFASKVIANFQQIENKEG